jgi:hypothetical protein
MAMMMMKEVTSIDQRNPVERHAGRPLLEYRHNDFHRDGKCRDLRERDHLSPDVRTLSGRILRARKRNIGEPAHIRSHVEREGNPEQRSTGQKHPV